MADEGLVDNLARSRYEQAAAADEYADLWPAWDAISDVERLVWRDGLDFAVAELAKRGRLVAAGTRTEWAVATPGRKQIHPVRDEAEARTCPIYGPAGVAVSRQVGPRVAVDGAPTRSGAGSGQRGRDEA